MRVRQMALALEVPPVRVHTLALVPAQAPPPRAYAQLLAPQEAQWLQLD